MRYNIGDCLNVRLEECLFRFGKQVELPMLEKKSLSVIVKLEKNYVADIVLPRIILFHFALEIFIFLKEVQK